MKLEEFKKSLCAISTDHELEEFSRLNLLHGTPFVFADREKEFYEFKKRICHQYGIHHTEVFIVGSGKLGFSPVKETKFSLDSDIDVALVSPSLWELVFELGVQLEYLIRSSRVSLRREQWKKYNEYLRYRALGWVRPDLIPHHPPLRDFKREWFEFFRSISYDQSEVGNYSVNAGLFRSQQHLELYTVNSLKRVQQKLEVKTTV